MTNKIIFSIYVDIPEENLDNPGWWENGVQVQTRKSLEAKLAFKRWSSTIIKRHKWYAETIGADYRLYQSSEDYKEYYETFHKKYPQISEYDIINFYKHHLMKEISEKEDYDLICYMDFDVIPNTSEDIFNEHDPWNNFCCAESNDEAIRGKEIEADRYNFCIRNPASKYWNTHAMLFEEGYEPDNDVFNTGIMVASKDMINKLDYFGNFEEVLELMTDLKHDEDSMYPTNIRRVFNYDNETVFSYKRVVNEVPIQFFDDYWHRRVFDIDTSTNGAKMYHVISKLFSTVMPYDP